MPNKQHMLFLNVSLYARLELKQSNFFAKLKRKKICTVLNFFTYFFIFAQILVRYAGRGRNEQEGGWERLGGGERGWWAGKTDFECREQAKEGTPQHITAAKSSCIEVRKVRSIACKENTLKYKGHRRLQRQRGRFSCRLQPFFKKKKNVFSHFFGKKRKKHA